MKYLFFTLLFLMIISSVIGRIKKKIKVGWAGWLLLMAIIPLAVFLVVCDISFDDLFKSALVAFSTAVILTIVTFDKLLFFDGIFYIFIFVFKKDLIKPDEIGVNYHFRITMMILIFMLFFYQFLILKIYLSTR